MAAVASSSSNTRIPIKLSPQLSAHHSHNGRTATYHALQRDSDVKLGGATLRTSGNNGSAGAAISLAASNGLKLDGRTSAADDHDYVLLYDDVSRVSLRTIRCELPFHHLTPTASSGRALIGDWHIQRVCKEAEKSILTLLHSQSYILHKLSSVSQLLGSSGGTNTNEGTPNARPKADKKTSGASHSPALIRTPQAASSPSLPSSSHKPLSQARDARKATDHLSKTVATGSGTAKKIGSQSRKNDYYNSSPTPSLAGGTPAAYGLGISTAANTASPSIKHGNAVTSNKGKAPIHDVEEFDMGSNSDEDLLSNSLHLPPSQVSVPVTSSRPADTKTGLTHQHHPGQGQPQKHPGPASGSTSLSTFSNQDVVMSEISSEDENDFDDLANDLESSLAGQGPFSRSNTGPFGVGGSNHNLISSDEDEDEDEDEDFVNALSEQTRVQAPQPQLQRPTPQSIPPVQQLQSRVQQIPQRTAQISQQPSSRPVQAGKKLPSVPRKYDSDIASSSESDDDSD